MIQIKRIFSFIFCIVLLSTLSSCALNKNALKILDNGEQLVAQVGSDRAVEKNDNKAYLKIVVDEAVEIIAETQELDKKKAEKELYKGGYTVYTAFDSKMNANLSKVCDEMDEKTDIAAAISDLSAHICAVYSSETDKKDVNFVTEPAAPCSAFKPLSVFAPALDNGTINWSSRYEDSPYTYIKNLEGVERPWPYNATGVYSKRYAYIFQAVKESINTVAVKCLADYGIDNSVEFLEENFSIPLGPEKRIVENSNYEQIIGNLALGALIEGVSPLDMAGYYQIFANGGKYQAPKAIVKICDVNGETIYTSEYAPKQVIKNTTADIMNRMLREVVTPGGTGNNAKCQNVEVAGKTGTDDNNKNNWFVGITPEYSCAFWHGQNSKNITTEIFSKAITAIYNDKKDYKKDFTYTSGIRKIVYCTESGKQFKSECSLINMGYYVPNNVPGLCDRH